LATRVMPDHLGHGIAPDLRNSPMLTRQIIPLLVGTHLPAIADDAMQQTGLAGKRCRRMWRKTMRIKLLAAVAAFGLSVAPAFAAENDSGYVFPDFWGTKAAAAQQPVVGNAPAQANGPTTSVYVTQSGYGTWLFPPDGNQGANS
jgi:hypothetical protein